MNETLSHCITALVTAAVAAVVRWFEKRKDRKKNDPNVG